MIINSLFFKRLAEMKSDALAILPTCLYTGQSALEPPCQEYIKVDGDSLASAHTLTHTHTTR